MKAGLGHTLRVIHESLRKRDYKTFALHTRNLYVSLKETDNALDECTRIVADAVLKVYNSFNPLPAVEVYNLAEKIFKDSFATALREKLSQDIDLFSEWRKTMVSLARERFSREIRDTIKTDDYQQALSILKKLLHEEGETKEIKNKLPLAGSILGSLVNDQERVDKFMEVLRNNHTSLGLTEEDCDKIEKVRKERFSLVYKSTVENRELEWTRTQSQAARDLKTFLPHANDLSEPTFEDMSRFRKLIQAIVNTAFMPDRESRWTDIILLLSELCPFQVSLTGTQAGVEGRIYEGLGKKARLIIDRIFKQFGEHPRFSETFINYISSSLEERYYKFAIALMGMFQSALFLPFLLDKYRDKKFRSYKPKIANALGKIGHPEASPLLIQELKSVLGARVIDPPRQAQALVIIRALSDILHSQRSSASDMNTILKEVIHCIPSGEQNLEVKAALEFFSESRDELKLGELRDVYVAWGVGALVKGLWSKDPTPTFAKEGERQKTILGHREQIAKSLIAMGRPIVPSIIKAANQQLHLFCGAYMAIGEVLAEIGDDSAVPLLEKMLLNTYVTEEKARSAYEQEYYWDASEGERKPLTRDKITSSLLYALDKIDSPAARKTLQDTMKRLQNKQIPNLGKESSQVLLNANMRIGRETGTSVFPTLGEAAKAEETPENKTAQTEVAYDFETIQELIKVLKKGSLLGLHKNEIRKEKITAIQQLCESKHPDAIHAIFDALNDSDTLVRESALTAVLELLSPQSPKQTIQNVCFEIVQTLDSKPRAQVQETIKKVINKIDLSRPVISEALESAMENMKNRKMHGMLREILDKSMKASAEREQPVAPAAGFPFEESTSDEKAEKEKPEEMNRFVDKLELRRQYMEERRRWIREGKQGPPPEPPPGIRD